MSAPVWNDGGIPFAKRETRKPIGHYFQIYVYNGTDDIPLEVESSKLRYDEFWSPYMQCEATCRVPDDVAMLDMLDPRKQPDTTIVAGYIYQDGSRGQFIVAKALLRSRTVDRPDNIMHLSFDSPEAAYREGGYWKSSFTYSAAGIKEFIESFLSAANFQVWAPMVLGLPSEYRPDLVPDHVKITDNDPLTTVLNIVDAAGLWLRPDDHWPNRLHVTPRPTRAGSAAETLTVGSNGTITASEADLSREDWYNSVLVVTRWTDAAGEERVRTGMAQVVDGPFAGYPWGPAARRQQVIERQGEATKAVLEGQAAAILRRSFTRGRRLNIEAVSAYWLRPGDTVTVQLPTGPQERHFVSAIEFRYPAGDMTIRTRQPENVTITTGE